MMLGATCIVRARPETQICCAVRDGNIIIQTPNGPISILLAHNDDQALWTLSCSNSEATFRFTCHGKAQKCDETSVDDDITEEASAQNTLDDERRILKIRVVQRVEEQGAEDRTEDWTEEGAVEGIEEDADDRTEEGAEDRTEDGAEERTEEDAEDRTEDRTEERTEDDAEERTEDDAEERTEDDAEDRTEGAVEGIEEGTEKGVEKSREAHEAHDAKQSKAGIRLSDKELKQYCDDLRDTLDQQWHKERKMTKTLLQDWKANSSTFFGLKDFDSIEQWCYQCLKESAGEYKQYQDIFHKMHLAKTLDEQMKRSKAKNPEYRCRSQMLKRFEPRLKGLPRKEKLKHYKMFERWINQGRVLLLLMSVEPGILLTVARFVPAVAFESLWRYIKDPRVAELSWLSQSIRDESEVYATLTTNILSVMRSYPNLKRKSMERSENSRKRQHLLQLPKDPCLPQFIVNDELFNSVEPRALCSFPSIQPGQSITLSSQNSQSPLNLDQEEDQFDQFLHVEPFTVDPHIRIPVSEQQVPFSRLPPISSGQNTVFETSLRYLASLDTFQSMQSSSIWASMGALLLLFLSTGISSLPVSVLGRIQHSQTRWSEEGERAETSPQESGIDLLVVHCFANNFLDAFMAENTHLLSFENGQIVLQRSKLRAVRLPERIRAWWLEQMSAMLRHAFPRGQALDTEYWTLGSELFDLINLISKMPCSDPLDMVSTMLSAFDHSEDEEGQLLLELAHRLVRDHAPCYLHAWVIRKRIHHSDNESCISLADELSRLRAGQQTLRFNAQLGRARVAYAEKLFRRGCIDDSIRIIQLWKPLRDEPSTLERLTISYINLFLFKSFSVIGQKDEARKCLEQAHRHVKYFSSSSVGLSRSLHVKIARYTSECLHSAGKITASYNFLSKQKPYFFTSKAHEWDWHISVSDLVLSRIKERRENHYFTRAKQTYTNAKEFCVQYRKQMGVFRAGLGLARIEHQQSRWEDARNRWLELEKILIEYGWDKSSTGAVVHFSMSHVLLEQGQFKESAKRWRDGEEIIEKEKVLKIWVPGMAEWLRWIHSRPCFAGRNSALSNLAL